MSSPFKIAILCGGPSLERGISLNSARSACDHLQGEGIEIVPIYFDLELRPYQISRAQLYSNTPSDFDFKLKRLARPLSQGELDTLLKGVNIALPAIHGRFGEDGELQSKLEALGVPHVGLSAESCRKGFDKHAAQLLLRGAGFYTLPFALLEQSDPQLDSKVKTFFTEQSLSRAIVKPTRSGSSFGVGSVRSVAEATAHARTIFDRNIDNRALLEPFCDGTEFTVIVLQNEAGAPVALLPTEITLDYSESSIFDYRKKYLASRQASYHCPPRFETSVISAIRNKASELFTLFGMEDLVRIDGWVLKDGNIYFSDINPVSGMEQNSFLFIQAAQCGMSHRDVLRYIVRGSAKRQGLRIPEDATEQHSIRKPVNVIFGGSTAERQVSVMSGTNVWLKLSRSTRYEPHPHLMDMQGRVWKLPYPLCLFHTVEEIGELCAESKSLEPRNSKLREGVISELGLTENQHSLKEFVATPMSLDEFVKGSKIVFIALHGGMGENGELQAMLGKAGVVYTGSGPEASRLGMDKAHTGEVVRTLSAHGIYTAPKRLLETSALLSMNSNAQRALWDELKGELKGETIIVKPFDDGCSAGVARLFEPKDLTLYLEHIKKGAALIPAGTLKGQESIIEMSTSTPEKLLFERFIESCRLRIEGDKLHWPVDGGDWIEVTVGVVGSKGKMRALSPSLTVANSSVLSLEEKFQGGTGVNITPPPEEYVSPQVIAKAKHGIELVANAIGLAGFSRIDAFLNYKNGELIIIEANTIPGLTPSTVIYHQALAENPPKYPTEFLEGIVDSGLAR